MMLWFLITVYDGRIIHHTGEAALYAQDRTRRVTMFGRFGRDARYVIALAEDLARAFGRHAVGPEHLTLALLAGDDEGVFESVGVRFDDVRRLLGDASQTEAEHEDAPPARLPLRVQAVFRAAFRVTAVRGDPEVTPWHLAVALFAAPPGEVSAILRRLDVSATDVNDAVMARLRDGAARSAKVVDLPSRGSARGRPGDADAVPLAARFSAAP